MKEIDYINATDLAKLRAARGILSDVFPALRGRYCEVFRLLDEWIEETNGKIETEEEE